MNRLVLSNTPDLIECCVNSDLKAVAERPVGMNEIGQINIQQALIVKDLISVFLGGEGNYIKFNDKYNINDNNLIIKGNDYKIVSQLDVSLKSLTKKVLKYGRFYNCITRFIEIYNKPMFGKILQRFIDHLIGFKHRYEDIIIEIINEFKFNASFTLLKLKNLLEDKVLNEMRHYFYIINDIHNETLKRQQNNNEEYFHNFIDYLSKDINEGIDSPDLSTDLMNFPICKGGSCLKILQDRIEMFKGDHESSHLLIELFNNISKSYIDSLNRWSINGIIDDPFDEFFIKDNQLPKNPQSWHEKYWDEKFLIRNDGLINQLNNKDIQKKILLTGKYLNIFKIVCNLENFHSFNETFQPIENFNEFELKVDFFYKRANKLMIKLIFEGFKFNDLINFYEKEFLLNDAFTVDKFIGQNLVDLSRDKYKVSVSKLARNFNNKEIELSIDSTNFFQLCKEILNIKSVDAEKILNSENANVFKDLLNKSLKPETSSEVKDKLDDMSIFGINIEHEIPFPMNLIINQSFNFEFQLIFKNQILLKFLNKLIDDSWKEINLSSVWKYKHFNKRVKKWIIRCRILHNRVRDFINEFQYYINFEIIEKNIVQLNEYLNGIEGKIINQTIETFEEQSTSNGKFFFNSNYNHLFQSKSVETDLEVSSITNNLGSFLNNILRDSFITNDITINIIRKLFYLIIDYNQFLLRLKKSIIMMDYDLYMEYNEIYPGKFQGNIDEESIESRFSNLNSLLNYYYESFNSSLGEFMVVIKNLGDLENQSFLVLMEKLEQCFPDN
ncbi:spindle pole body component Spc97p [[Candida] jaroonii]|uniref:Spindle pole body component Spc97p n=1 Tax=[Candida] jaroonii TaxID=467808 RepID=A0ACA9Y9Q4_9ASCO|nr:spindle pole body component Spc97p [[Candida] jaroonii]